MATLLHILNPFVFKIIVEDAFPSLQPRFDENAKFMVYITNAYTASHTTAYDVAVAASLYGGEFVDVRCVLCHNASNAFLLCEPLAFP